MIAFVRTLTVAVSLSVASGAFAQPAAPATPEKGASAWGAAMQRIDGYMPLYWDAAKGKLTPFGVRAPLRVRNWSDAVTG